MTLLGQREVRQWSPYAAYVGGLGSGLNLLLQRTFWKQRETSECGLGKGDTARDVRTVGWEGVRGGPGPREHGMRAGGGGDKDRARGE